jgi:hypothetical protein
MEEKLGRILKKELKQSDLPEAFYDYMAKMIIEEPPSSYFDV